MHENKKKSSKELDTILGTLKTHPRGFGFVIPDDPLQSSQDIFIPKHLIGHAVDGDTVEVLINSEVISDKGPEGKIISVQKRGRTHMVGVIHHIDKKEAIFAYTSLLSNKYILVQPSPKINLTIGDRVALKIEEWGNEQNNQTVAHLSHLIGNISDPIYDIPAAAEEFELRTLFPNPVLKQAKAYGESVKKKDQNNRVDLTSLAAITIDPQTAKDFDDALAISKDKQGHFHLSVHIADVAHYVPADSPLDIEAARRANSTYFPGKCIPMLPEELSNLLCSLRPKVIRLTVSVLMEFDKEGNLIHQEIVRAFIKSRKRMTYEEAKEIIDGKRKSPYAKSLESMVELCHLLKKKRHERGSIDFSLPELVIIVDEKGVPTGTKWVEYDISHQLVEEFMLKANEVVAKFLTDKGSPPIYRVHEEPSEENMTDFFALARSLGFKLSSHPNHEEIQKLFNTAKTTPFATQLSVAFIRSMKLATYSPDNVGHYGLSLEYYCHFTSPIRRYSDLITQRLLFNEEGVDLDLQAIASKCGEQERASFKAENSVKLLKKLRLLNAFLKENPSQVYEATVTRIKPFGLYFEIKELSLEGFLHISELENDYFIFLPESNQLVGKHNGQKHQVGESLKVAPLSVDLILLEAKWTLITNKRKRK